MVKKEYGICILLRKEICGENATEDIAGGFIPYVFFNNTKGMY